MLPEARHLYTTLIFCGKNTKLPSDVVARTINLNVLFSDHACVFFVRK